MICGTLLVALLGFLLGGCSKESAVGGHDLQPSVESQSVRFSLLTGLETYGNPIPAFDYEKSIRTTQVLLFDQSGKFLRTVSPSGLGNNNYFFQVSETGSYKMLVVANHSFTDGELRDKTISEVGAEVVKVLPGIDDQFVMVTSSAKDFDVKANTPTTLAEPLILTRLAVRVDIKSSIDKLKLTKATLKQRKIESTLLPSSAGTSVRATADQTYEDFLVQKQPSTIASVGQIYAYENSEAGTTTIEISTTYGGKSLKPITVPLPVMLRNYIYSVNLVVDNGEYDPTEPTDPSDPSGKPGKLSYTLEVLDWNTGRTIQITEDQLLQIINSGKEGFIYTINATSNPDLSTPLESAAGTVTLIPTAEKRKTVGGQVDPNTPATAINAPDQFSYEVVGASGAPWLSVSERGVVTVSPNDGETPRSAMIRVTIKEDSNSPKAEKTALVQQKGAGVLTTEYRLVSVSPDPVTFSKPADFTALAIEGSVTQKRDGVVIDNRKMDLDDVTIEKVGSADWLTIRGDRLSVSDNKSGAQRSAKVKITVKNDATQSRTVSVVQDGPRWNNPLAYVAKYNVTSGKTWDKNHTIPSDYTDRNLLMDWNTAMAKYGDARSIQGSTETYKLPSREAWQGIVKYEGSQTFGSGDVQYNKTEQVEVAGQKFNATGDYKPTIITVNGSSVKCNVALRFKGDDPTEKQYRSAWLYYWGTNAVNGKSVPGLWIYCVNISGRQGITTVDNLDQNFWDQSLSSAVVRFFPATGGSFGYLGTGGGYWSTTEYHRVDACTMYFNSSFVYMHFYNTPHAFAVRLFASAPLD